MALRGFLLASNLQIKEFGFGLIAAIALDATLMRLVLVPAVMKLMGRANSWMPDALRRFAGQGATSGEGDAVPDCREALEMAG